MGRDAQDIAVECDYWVTLTKDIAAINTELAPIAEHVASIPVEVLAIVAQPEDVFGSMVRIQEKAQLAVDGVARVQAALVRMCELADGRATMLRAEQDDTGETTCPRCGGPTSVQELTYSGCAECQREAAESDG